MGGPGRASTGCCTVCQPSTPVLPGEDASKLEDLTRRVTVDVQPQGVVEEFMAERVALGMWRLRRAERAERHLMPTREKTTRITTITPLM